MPQIRFDTSWTPEEAKIVSQIKGRNGLLRTSKPENGEAAYVWRMVAFQVSTHREHHCMPVMAFCYIPIEDDDARQARMKELDVLVVNLIPKTEWHGISWWSNVLR